MPAAPPDARSGVRHRPRRPSRRASATAVGLVLALTSVVPAAFADTGPTTPAAPSAASSASLAETMAAADAERTKEKPAATSATDKALARAKATGKPVPVPELTDEFSETVATPEGHLSRTEHPEQQRVKQDGGWAALDATLVPDQSGGYRPRAAAADVHLSAGGPGPLGTLTGSDGETLSIDSPFPLTTPAVDEDGDGLVYPEVAPGVDLKATVTKAGGLSTVLIVKTPEAAANPKLQKIRFGTTTKGVTVQTDASNNLTATAEDGTVRWHAPAPQMWDSSGTATSPAAKSPAAPAGKSAQAAPAQDGTEPSGGAPQKSTQPSSAAGPGAGAKVAAMPTTVSADGIELTTDQSVLGKGQGPWFIDPNWIPDRREGNAWTWTQQAYPTTPNFLKTTSTDGQYARPGVGYQGYLAKTGIERSYFQFDTRWYNDIVIHKATMSVWEYESSDFSCTTTYPVDLYLTDPINNGTTWNNPPGTVGGRVGRADVAGSGDAACHDNREFQYDVTSTYQNYAPSRDTLTFGLFAGNESNKLAFKRLTYNPVVVVEYDRYPDTPTNPNAWPVPNTAVPWADNQGCDGSSVAWMNSSANFNGNVSLNVNVHSPVQNALQSWAHIWDYSLPGAPNVAEGYSPEVANGGVASFQVPPSVVKDGHVYGWSAHARDELVGLSPNATPTCRFGIDLTPPTLAVPNVYTQLSEADLANRFPPSGNGQVTRKRAGEWGVVPFTAADPAPNNGTASGVICARWSWDPQLTGAGWSCGSDLPQGGINVLPTHWGTNIAYVQVMDNARNRSPIAQYAFYVPWNPDGPPPAFGDLTGDSAPDVLAVDEAGYLRAFNAPGNPKATSPAVSAVAAPTDAPTNQGWANVQLAHRGTLTGGHNVDDVLAHAPGDANLWIYQNPGNDGTVGRLNKKQELLKPGCVQSPTENCSWRTTPGYNATDWTKTLRVAALGDPVNADLDPKLSFKNKTGVLTVESTNNGTDAALWYYPATANNTLGKPVQLAASGWKDKELISPGDWAKQGHPGLWARNLQAAPDGGQGDILAYTFDTGTVTATTQEGYPIVDGTGKSLTVPTLTRIATTTKIGGVPTDGWPTLGSDGDLTGSGFPTLWGKRNDGRIDIWWGQTTNPGTPNAGFTWQVGPQTIGYTTVNPLWWALDGRTSGDTGDTNKLYPSNNVTLTTDHNGVANKATAFDGTKVYRSTAPVGPTVEKPGLDTTQSYSIAAWVKLNNTNGYQTAVSMAGNERSPFYLQYSAMLGKWAFVMSGADSYNTGAYYSAVDRQAPSVGVWTHLVGTYNAGTGTATLFVNGKAAGVTNVPTAWKVNGSLNIGGETTSTYPGPDSRLNGAVSDVRVYPYPLTDQQANTLATTSSTVQIRSVYNAGKCIDNWGGTIGANAALYDCYNGDAQHFTLTATNQIQVPGTTRCLGTKDKPAGWGSTVTFQPCGDAAAQTWVRRYDGSLYNPDSGTCLELPDWKDQNGTALGVWQCNGNPNQRWFFEAQTK
ncbi:LamG-like jellyroll fold domain-containing protein [Kitasatospora sp. NPDC088548]|uniref:LamG-like jellyroll fold domain-containing protein n=1 Tax=Kitasatospora sp. NPDC088548 TaxID=3364075 RepID=UPI00380D38B1